MNALTPIVETLPSLVSRAASALANATNAAEVLEAQEKAAEVYDAAKRHARLVKAKGAHDEVIAAVFRAQADALLIESRAKARLADEYDAAQQRGDVRGDRQRTASTPEAVGATEIGLTHKQVHEARKIRDAEQADPGIVERVLNDEVAAGKEPTRAALRREVIEAATAGLKGGASRGASRSNPSYKPDPQFDAMLAVSAGCRDMLEKVRGFDPAYIVGGFVDADQRHRNIALIRECRDFLNTVLEFADAE